MRHQWKSAAQMSQIFIIYCLSVTTMSNQGKSGARMLQNFLHTLHFIGCKSILLSEVGVVVCTLSCSATTTMSHQGKSVGQMSQNFHHTWYISDYNVSPMEICGTNVADFYHILYISDYNVEPMEICGTNVTEFSSYIVY
jgi:hypothetical protein